MMVWFFYEKFVSVNENYLKYALNISDNEEKKKDISTSSFSSKIVTFHLLHCQSHRSTNELRLYLKCVFRGKIMHLV